MGQGSRTFKLRLSPAGMNVLIEAHCRVIRATKQLLAWGTTLHAALAHLESLPTEAIVSGLGRIATAGLDGTEVHYLGAPCVMSAIAARISARVAAVSPAGRPPTLLHIYILALEVATSAALPRLRSSYERLAVESAGGRAPFVE